VYHTNKITYIVTSSCTSSMFERSQNYRVENIKEIISIQLVT